MPNACREARHTTKTSERAARNRKSGACEDLRPPLFAQHNTPQVIASFKHAFGRISRRPSPLSTPFIVPSMHGCTLNHDHHTTTHLRHSDLLSMHGLHPSNVVRCVGGGYGWTRTVSSGSCMMHDDVTHTITDTQTLTDTLRSIVGLGTVSRPDSRQQTTRAERQGRHRETGERRARGAGFRRVRNKAHKLERC